MLIYLAVEEVLFYAMHRLLHHPHLYRFIHKKHHLFTAPIGMAAIYAHPVEHILASLLPVCIGPLLVRHTIYAQSEVGNLFTWWLWNVLVIVNIVQTHSGYALPCLPEAEMHDLHHQLFTKNFGVMGIMDALFGTGTATATKSKTS